MASSIIIALVKIQVETRMGQPVLVPHPVPLARNATLTSSGTSQATTIVANAATLGTVPAAEAAWMVHVLSTGDKTIEITSGAAPTAVAGQNLPIAPGTTAFFAVTENHKLAAIEAT